MQLMAVVARKVLDEEEDCDINEVKEEPVNEVVLGCRAEAHAFEEEG